MNESQQRAFQALIDLKFLLGQDVSASLEDDMIHVHTEEGAVVLDFDRAEGNDSTVRYAGLGVSYEELTNLTEDDEWCDAVEVAMHNLSALAYHAAGEALSRISLPGPSLLATLTDGRWELRCPHCGSDDLQGCCQVEESRDLSGAEAITDMDRMVPVIRFGSNITHGDSIDDGRVFCRDCYRYSTLPADYEALYG